MSLGPFFAGRLLTFSPAGGDGGRFRISLRIRITKRRRTAKKVVSSVALLALPGLTFPSNNHELTPMTPKACLDKLILDRVHIGERSVMNCELKLMKLTNAGATWTLEMLPRVFYRIINV